MKEFATNFITLVVFVFAYTVSAGQATGDYRSAVASGNWNATASWQRFNGTAWVAAPSIPISTDGVISILSGNNIAVTAATTADQIVIDAGGTLTNTSTLTLDNGAGDDLTVSGILIWNAGTIAGTGNAFIAASGTLSLATTSSKSINASLTNNGTINWQDGILTLAAATTLTNAAGATMNISGNNPINSSTATFINNGTVTKSSTGTTTFNIGTVTQAGTMNLNAGILSNNSTTWNNTGSLNLNTGAFTNTGAAFNHNTGSVISGTGNFNNNGGTLTLNIDQVFAASLVFANTATVTGPGNLTINNDFIIQGTITGAGSLTINANSTWNSGTLARALTIGAGNTLSLATTSSKSINASLTNNGTINWQDGILTLAAATTLTNAAGATMNISGNNPINSSTATFINNGTVTKSSTGTTTFNIGTVTQASTMNLNAGILSNNSTTWNNTGSLNLNTGAFTNTGAAFNHNTGSVISGTGNFNNNGGTLTLNIDQVFAASLVFANTATVTGPGNLTINNDFIIQGTITGAGSLTINANSTWNSGTLARALTIGAGNTLSLATTSSKSINASLTNNGTINWQDGILTLAAATTLTNAAGATMNISGNNPINSSTATFINNGTVTKSSTGTTTFNIGTVTQAGTMNLNAGILSNNSTTWNNTGSLNLNTGAFTNTGAAFNHNTGSVISGTGNFNNNGGTLTLNIDQVFAASLVFANTATVTGPGNLTINNDFIIQGTITGAGSLTINANSTWNSGTLARALTIGAGNTLSLATTSSKSINASLTNNGTINWQDGILTLAAATTLTNAAGATMNISGNNPINSSTATFINNGTVTKSSTGTTTFNIGTVTNSNTGVIKGVGTITNSSTTFNSNGIIAPGLSPGLLTFNTAQPLSATSTLQIEMQDGSGAGTGHDQLIRNSSLTLGGTLTVTEIGTVPNGTYTIANLTVGTVSGSFATTNLPSGYTLQVNSTNVQVIKNVVLPLHFISFTGSKQNNTVLLQWKTENEINTSHFEIQKSSDGINFITIATVTANNSTGTNNYSYTDVQSNTANKFYRLKQIDIDGRFTYSSILKIQFAEKSVFTIYPNPAVNELSISGATPGSIIYLYDAGGKQLISKKITAQSLTINMSGYAKGTYLLTYDNDGERKIQKIIKQ